MEAAALVLCIEFGLILNKCSVNVLFCENCELYCNS